MSVASAIQSLAPALFFLFVLALVMARRTYRLTRGARYRPSRTIYAYGALSLALFALLGSTTIYLAVGVWGTVALALLVPYGAAVAGATWLVNPVVQRHVRFERRPDGQVYYRLPVFVPVASLALFLVRVGAEIALFGFVTIGGPSTPSSLPIDLLVALIVLDLLYGVSVGLLLGRAAGIRAAYSAFAARAAPLPSG